MADNKQLVSRMQPNGQAVFYQMKADAPAIKAIAGRGAGGRFSSAPPSNATDMGVSP
jgi:hypothetical protein